MPRNDPLTKHIKQVKRRGVTYLYFNTGQKVDGKPVYVPLGKKGGDDVGTRYSDALRARNRRNNDPSGLSVPQLMRRYDASPEFTKKSVGTQKTYSVYLRRLANEMNNAPANGVEEHDVIALMDKMADTPAAVDMLLLAGGQMYAWAKKRKLVSHNPFEGIDREDWEQRQYEPWPEDVLREALADDKIGLPVALLYYTAQRIGDVCAMRWDQLSDDGISVHQQKTGKDLLIPLHSELAEALASAPRVGPTILTGATKRKLNDQTLRGWIKDFGTARGLTLVPHGLRKNAVIALLEAECSIGEVSSISGQSLQMVEHYARRRNNRRMSKAGMAKWERATNKETTGKTSQESAVN